MASLSVGSIFAQKFRQLKSQNINDYRNIPDIMGFNLCAMKIELHSAEKVAEL